MATSTVENYLKALYALQQQTGQALVPMGALAERVGVTAGTATTMIKRLSQQGQVTYQPRKGVRLTLAGEGTALKVLRRHRLIELFLVEVLQLDWSDVHEEAEVLEHALSDRLVEKIDEMLGRPAFDPHGDPIPGVTGKIASREVMPMSECPPGPQRIARVTDHAPTFLQFIEQRGLGPGQPIELLERDVDADTITLKREDGSELQLGMAAASKILVLAT